MKAVLMNRNETIQKIYNKSIDSGTSYITVEHDVDNIPPIDLIALADEDLIDITHESCGETITLIKVRGKLLEFVENYES